MSSASPADSSARTSRITSRLGLAIVVVAALVLIARLPALFAPAEKATDPEAQRATRSAGEQGAAAGPGAAPSRTTTAGGAAGGAAGNAVGDAAGAGIERRVALAPGALLRLSVDAGDVSVAEAPGAGAPDAEVPGSSEATLVVALRPDFGPSDLEWEVEGDESERTVTIRSKAKERRGFLGLFTEARPAVIDSVWLELPPGARLVLATGAGDVSLGQLTGDVEVTSGAGDVRAEHVGGDLMVRVGAGDVVARVDGRADIDSGAGDLTLTAGRAEVTTRTGAGEVALELVAVRESIDVRTGIGSIAIVVPGDAAFELDAATALGTIAWEVAGGETVRTRGTGGTVRQSIGEGGPTLRTRTGAGAITITPRETARAD